MDNYQYCANLIASRFTPGHSKVLDYGCGAGEIVSRLKAKGFEAVGCDVFFEGGDYSASVPAELMDHVIFRMSGNAAPFEDQSFDVVINNQVLEHVSDLNAVVTEMWRVLRPGGTLVCLFPDASVWREGHCGVPFLHWFPKKSNFRVYYAAFFRLLGFGYHKGEKGILEWSRDFCSYLDNWTFYRPYAEIELALRNLFSAPCHIEEHWLQERLGRRAFLVAWLPGGFQRFLVRKLGGMIFMCSRL